MFKPGSALSFSRNDLVLDDRDVSFVSVEADLVTQWEVSTLTIAKRQGQLVVGLWPLVDLALLHSNDGWILRIEPRSLDISGALRVIDFVNFATKSRRDLHTLLVHWSWSAQSTLNSLRVGESILVFI